MHDHSTCLPKLSLGLVKIQQQPIPNPSVLVPRGAALRSEREKTCVCITTQRKQTFYKPPARARHVPFPFGCFFFENISINHHDLDNFLCNFAHLNFSHQLKQIQERHHRRHDYLSTCRSTQTPLPIHRHTTANTRHTPHQITTHNTRTYEHAHTRFLVIDTT